MPFIFPLLLDADGNHAEAEPFGYDFSTKQPIIDGDTILTTPVPVINQVAPEGQPLLTLGTPQVTGPTTGIAIAGVKVQVSITGGQNGAKYETTCRVQTAQGNTLIVRGDFVLVGPS